jgi:hypothetical protein
MRLSSAVEMIPIPLPLLFTPPRPPTDYPEEFIEALDFMMKLGDFLTPLELLGRT